MLWRSVWLSSIDVHVGGEPGRVVPWSDQAVVRRQQLVHLARHLDPRRHQHDQVVADPLEVGHQVRREDHAHAMVDDHLHQALEELAPGQRVEAGHRLVEDEELGPLGHGQGEGELGPLATREGAGPLARVQVQLVDAPPGHGVVPARVHVGAHGQVVLHTEAGVGRGVLGHEAHPGQLGRVVGGRLAQHLDAARARAEQPDGQVQQGGLAGAVGADQSDHVAGRDVEIALLERPAPAVALAQALAR